MAYENKEGSGALFPNDKGENPSRPDYRGDIMLGGVLYELSGWIKVNGEKRMLSLAGKPKQARPPAQSFQQRPPARGQDMRPSPPMKGFDEMDSDDVPF